MRPLCPTFPANSASRLFVCARAESWIVYCEYHDQLSSFSTYNGQEVSIIDAVSVTDAIYVFSHAVNLFLFLILRSSGIKRTAGESSHDQERSKLRKATSVSTTFYCWVTFLSLGSFEII